MRMYLIAYPRFVPVLKYDLAIQRMVKKLKQQDGVVSIFQVGSVNNPGISDIDMLVVFEEGVECNLNPLEDLSKSERYLFSHNLYGISETHFSEAQRFTFFHNYNLLWGDELLSVQSGLSKEQIQTLKTQTALEYLLQMYISLTVKLTYGIFRIVGLLRHVNALRYDLQFLNISSGKLFDLIETLVSWRNNWFKNKPTTQMLKIWIDDFYKELSEFLREILHTTKFYLPEWANLCIAKNMTLVASKELGYTHRGMTLPTILGDLGKKYFNIQHRFNVFKFHIPITSQAIPRIIEERREFLKQVKDQNSIGLPHFMSTTTSLNIL